MQILVRRGSFRSGSARLGRSQKDGLPSSLPGWHGKLGLKAINSRTGRGSLVAAPFNRERKMDGKTRHLVLLAALSLFCATAAWSADYAVFASVFLVLSAVAVLRAAGPTPRR
jgi:hypothetical protein